MLEHQDVLARLLLDLRDLLHEVALDQRGVVPVDLVERGRRHVLPHAVDLVRELPDRDDHASTKPSYVSRPISRASLADSTSHAYWPASSSK